MELVVVGILPNGQAVGFARDSSGRRFAVGVDRESLTPDPRPAAEQRADLIALAMAHFEEQLDEPATGDGATHEDLADLVRWLGEADADPEAMNVGRLALDAIEDGLPGDAVALSLAALLELETTRAAPVTAPPDDPVERLLARARALAEG